MKYKCQKTFKSLLSIVYFCAVLKVFNFNVIPIQCFLTYIYFERVGEDVESTLSVAKDDGDM